MSLFINSSPSVLETAATLLRTFSDRAPSADRRGLREIADAFEEEAQCRAGDDYEVEDARDSALDSQGYSL